jgi:hypothetical protein
VPKDAERLTPTFGAGDEAVMGGDGKQMHTSTSSTNTLWIGKFYEGMGDQPRPDGAMREVRYR